MLKFFDRVIAAMYRFLFESKKEVVPTIQPLSDDPTVSEKHSPEEELPGTLSFMMPDHVGERYTYWHDTGKTSVLHYGPNAKLLTRDYSVSHILGVTTDDRGALVVECHMYHVTKSLQMIEDVATLRISKKIIEIGAFFQALSSLEQYMLDYAGVLFLDSFLEQLAMYVGVKEALVNTPTEMSGIYRAIGTRHQGR